MALIKKIQLMILFLSLPFLLTGCSEETISLDTTGFYFDTAVQITVTGTKKEQAKLQQGLDDALNLCQKYNQLLSRTEEGSDIYQINHSNGEWVSIDESTSRILYLALNYCDLSDGHVDITIAPVKDLWPFSTDASKDALPTFDKIQETLTNVDYTQVELDQNRVRLLNKAAQIDLGFVAKGFIADEIKAKLIEDQIDSALIDLGGNILVLGSKPDNTPYKIGIKKPFTTSGEILATVDAMDSSNITTVVTSGVYERYFNYDDTLYHHLLDARTGYPAETNLYSVTILTNSSINADALSTTCFIMGLEWSKKLLSTLDGVDAIFITDQYEIIDTRN